MEYKVYTKTGDKGGTSLLGGHRVPKSNERLEAYGTVDELNSWIGMIRSFDLPSNIIELMIKIQNNLFVIGSNLAYDEANAKHKMDSIASVNSLHVKEMEEGIDEMNKILPELKEFVLPGGSILSSYCHIARTVCRRGERRVVALSQNVDVDESVIVYLNRLSDYLFILSRYVLVINDIEEFLWVKEL